MPKAQTEYSCQACGACHRQYFGKCPACGGWNTLVEQRIEVAPVGGKATSTTRRSPFSKTADPQPLAAQTLDQIADVAQARIPAGSSELDRVLGGGIVPGSLVLIGGDPGIGKSTLLLQTAQRLADRLPILYVCAEESGQQIKLRWQRIAGNTNSDTSPTTSPNLHLLPETNLDEVLAELESLRPAIAVIDSIQALYLPALASAPGSVAQVRECTAALMRLAKKRSITLFIVGHVTKDGAIAGPKVLEHLVDTVLYFEGDRFASHRLLRAVKNRFGPTHELGIFEMVDQGLEEVVNPSALFLGSREDLAPGTAVIVACEGTRPLVVELQALVCPTSYSAPRRVATGLEYNRLVQILAVLERRVGMPLSKFDAYVSAAGGLSVTEPAADLGAAVALVASFRDRLVRPDTVLIGEVGLGGQIRTVSQLEIRLRESVKLGFRRAVIPKGQATLRIPGLELQPVGRLIDALGVALQASPLPGNDLGDAMCD